MQEQEIGAVVPSQPANRQTVNSLKLYAQAKACLDTSLVPAGDDPEYGCAISMNILSLKTFGTQIGGGASTSLLLQNLIASEAYIEVTDRFPQAGDIVIAATGTSVKPNPDVANGHVGVLGYFGLMSNNSNNGLWQEVYTLETFTQRYNIEGGFPIRFFRHV